MAHWQRILFEVENRYNPEVVKYCVHFPEMNDVNKEKKVVKEVIRKQYYLEGDLSHLYLTEREYQCACGLVCGMTYLALAKALKLSDRTIESYIIKLKNKLGCRSRMQLVQTLVAHGVVVSDVDVGR